MAGRPGDESVASAGLVARHLAGRLGLAEIRVDNRTTMSGIDALNDFAATGGGDGSVLLLAPPMTGLMQALGAPGVAYDAGKFAWIGALSQAPLTLAASWVTGFKTLADGQRREMDLGAVGDSGQGAWYPAIVNSLTRARFRVSPSFRSDKEIDAAIASSEIGGRFAGWSTLLFGQSELFNQGKLAYLVRVGGTGIAELASAPALVDAVANPRDRDIAALVSIDPGHGRALAAAPGTPPDLLARERAAFMAMAADPAFLAEAKAAHVEVSPVDGAAVAALMGQELAASPQLVARTRAAISGGAR